MLKSLSGFLKFEGIPPRVIIVTAFLSYLFQVSAIVMGNPLYLIALATLLPWIPLFVFEGIWKVKNYSVVALLALFTILQIGHFAEHLIQVIQLQFLNGTVACPPPVDNVQNYQNAVDAGLRDVFHVASFFSVDVIAKAGPDGLPLLDGNGEYLTGPAACAIFGQLDLEIVHLSWELIGYFGTALVLYYFARNIWLLIALICLSWHGVEHLTITYFYYFDQDKIFPGLQQLWATVPLDGNRYIAVPAGVEETLLNFYQAGGKFGIMAKNGLFEQWTGFQGMPGRAYLHMGYNLAITVPTVIGCLVEMRKLRSAYLEQTFSALSEAELIKLTQDVDNRVAAKGDAIITEGEPSTEAFVIKSGTVHIYKDYGTAKERKLATVGAGELIGEMGLLNNTDRTASAICDTRVAYIAISAKTFRDLVEPEGGEYQSEDTSEFVRRLSYVRDALNRG